ncbi:DinB family protein [Candidatus Bipolaricaulota bacterium]|nr:DinB family protein [Candidatus Bipolaricaulota bacterium]
MTLVELLKTQVEDTYQATDALVAMVTDDDLGWKPNQGGNWLSVGQLLRHMTVSCGIWCKGFVTDIWDDAGDVDYAQVPEGEALPQAGAYRSVDSMAEAREALAADKAVALQMLGQTTDEDLLLKAAVAPWNPNSRMLGLRLLDMVRHLESHKSQLYYYLKLMGKPVHTGHLWGMGNVVED